MIRNFVPAPDQLIDGRQKNLSFVVLLLTDKQFYFAICNDKGK